ncbi:hypothetical protein A8B75_18725 [Sphingomonadales bacterium EhC05]|nr:hypothetical protein A8B75_18725 [Sphingomonadales bacterium EhC05]
MSGPQLYNPPDPFGRATKIVSAILAGVTTFFGWPILFYISAEAMRSYSESSYPFLSSSLIVFLWGALVAAALFGIFYLLIMLAVKYVIKLVGRF